MIFQRLFSDRSFQQCGARTQEAFRCISPIRLRHVELRAIVAFIRFVSCEAVRVSPYGNIASMASTMISPRDDQTRTSEHMGVDGGLEAHVLRHLPARSSLSRSMRQDRRVRPAHRALARAVLGQLGDDSA
jgi:hypothetical protein